MKKALEDMNIHELRTRRDEVWAELEAVEARMRELEPPIGWSSKVQRNPLQEPEPEPKPNAQPEGADA
jgi:hypothetical protein